MFPVCYFLRCKKILKKIMSDPLKFYDRATGKELELTPEGSLGLLALGDVSVKPWRQKRIESGYEKDLLERTAKQAGENIKRAEEMKKKREEMKRKKEQEKNEQAKS